MVFYAFKKYKKKPKKPCSPNRNFNYDLATHPLQMPLDLNVTNSVQFS